MWLPELLCGSSGRNAGPPPSDPQTEDTQIQAPSRVHPGRVLLVCRADPLGLRRTAAFDPPLLLFFKVFLKFLTPE